MKLRLSNNIQISLVEWGEHPASSKLVGGITRSIWLIIYSRLCVLAFQHVPALSWGEYSIEEWKFLLSRVTYVFVLPKTAEWSFYVKLDKSKKISLIFIHVKPSISKNFIVFSLADFSRLVGHFRNSHMYQFKSLFQVKQLCTCLFVGEWKCLTQVFFLYIFQTYWLHCIQNWKGRRRRAISLEFFPGGFHQTWVCCVCVGYWVYYSSWLLQVCILLMN